MKKRSFFLLEIVIAIFLVGLFGVYFLRSSIHCLYKEREALLDIAFEKEFDIKRMDRIAQHWTPDLPLRAAAKELPLNAEVNLSGKKYFRTKKCKIYRSKQEQKEYCKMVFLEGSEKTHFLIKKL